MRRPVEELIEAVFAGDPITPEARRRLLRHMDHAKRIGNILLLDVSPQDIARSEAAGMGAEFKSYRSMILRDLRKFT